MQSRKFIIINNGMKDLRGHYFETSVSIAQSARQLGLEPVLAAHVTCDELIAAPTIDIHRVMTTDHWMPEPPPPALDRHGVRGELAPVLAAPISALLDGSIDFRDYLAARFDLPDDTPQAPFVAAVPDSARAPSRLFRTCDKLKRRISRWYQSAHARALWQRFTARNIPGAGHAEADEAEPSILLTTAAGGPGAAACAAERIRTQADRFERIGAAQELEYIARFRRDLEQLLTLVGCRADDHVFLPTAHGRELVAIHELIESVGGASLPRFHLEFRHALTDWYGVPPELEHPYYTVHKVLFQLASTFPATDRLHLYTDTQELSEEYGQLAGRAFGVLPIPFRSELIETQSREDGPLRLVFLGDARDEKGFHWLPDLVEAMMDQYVRPGHVRFIFQASPVAASWNAGSCEACNKLRRYDQSHVQLVGTQGPLSPEEYFQLVSQVDVLLCPFDARAYRSRSSGTLAEAIAAGVPAIVPHGSWLSSSASTSCARDVSRSTIVYCRGAEHL